MPYAQLVVGPPGSGKSTYCHGMQQFLSPARKPVLVNLDPANETMPYVCDINIMDLCSVETVMERELLGPNGALLRCMERLELHVEDWLLSRVAAFDEESYFVFDLPGQVELFTCHESLLNIIRILTRRHFRFVVVHLADAAHCTDAMKYISMLLVTLKSMMQLECPQINVLSKVDLVECFDTLPVGLEYYTDVQDLHYLFAGLEEDAIGRKYRRLNEAICELIEDTSLLSFIPLAIEDKDCMAFLLSEVDRANGYAFGGLTAGNDYIMATAMSCANRSHIIELVKERYLLQSNEAALADPTGRESANE